jgi:hypothetical protein
MDLRGEEKFRCDVLKQSHLILSKDFQTYNLTNCSHNAMKSLADNIQIIQLTVLIRSDDSPRNSFPQTHLFKSEYNQMEIIPGISIENLI